MGRVANHWIKLLMAVGESFTVWQIILEELALHCPGSMGMLGRGGYYSMGFFGKKEKKAIFQSTEIVYNFLPSRMTHSGSLPALPSPPSHHPI